MNPNAWTVIVAVIGALAAAVSGAFAYKAAGRAKITTVDKDHFDSLRADFRAAKDEIRELEREVDSERRRRRDMEEALHRIARALYAAGIPIPAEVAELMRPPGTHG